MHENSKFNFNQENLKEISLLITRYQSKRSIIIHLLHMAQSQDGWVSNDAVEEISKILEISPGQVHEVASFYTMINRRPIGKHHVQICRTTPCWLRGSDKLSKACKNKFMLKNLGETTKDKKFTFTEVECLGACRNAPIVQINQDYYEDLDENKLMQLLDSLDKNE